MRVVSFLSLWIRTWALYFQPQQDPALAWHPPLLQPWDPLRAQPRSVTVTWTPAWNHWCASGHYILEARYPAGSPLHFADLEPLQNREADRENSTWPGDDAWTPWEVAYDGLGRSFALRVETGQGHAVQVRVKGCGRGDILPAAGCGCSEWSPVQTVHTILSAAVDKINFFIQGTGKNAHDYSIIEVNRRTIYRRRDEAGLVLAVFSRLDLSLQWLRTYDTHLNRSKSLDMSKDLRLFNNTHLVVVVSATAWEWHATRSLVKAMEFCGALHFGQWAYIFAEQPHYASPVSDLQADASQREFGHPYAFIGIPGIGSGMGWESLMYNTGFYLADNVKVPKAVIRGVAYYDYIARLYRLTEVVATKADFFLRNNPPGHETLHNPMPARKAHSPLFQMMQTSYVPYYGTLTAHITKLIEANATVPPYNFAFALQSLAGVIKVDPRPMSYWQTELERVWSGPSMRWWYHNSSILRPGLELEERYCSYFMYWGYTMASPESCGANFTECCDYIDVPGILALACSIGVAPILCRYSNTTQVVNTTPLTTAMPFPFTVINRTEYPFIPGEGLQSLFQTPLQGVALGGMSEWSCLPVVPWRYCSDIYDSGCCYTGQDSQNETDDFRISALLRDGFTSADDYTIADTYVPISDI